jgi:hypothetical protein
MTETILFMIAFAFVTIHLGALYIMQSSILPLLNSRELRDYLATCKAIDMFVFHKIALWGGIVIMGVGVYLVTLLDETVAQVCVGIATLMFVIVGAVSESTNRPIWRKIENVWTGPENTPSDWKRQRRVWSTAHTVRTLAAFVSTAGYVVGGIVEFG